MNRSDMESFATMLYSIAELCGQQLTEDSIKMWFALLKPYEISDIKKAAIKILQTHKKRIMPMPADFIEILAGPQETIKDHALVQATRVLDCLKKHGVRVMPNFTDPITREIMTTRFNYLHWGALHKQGNDPWLIRDFCELYRSYEACSDKKLYTNKELLKIANSCTKRIPEKT
jgi:hypothetical protein